MLTLHSGPVAPELLLAETSDLPEMVQREMGNGDCTWESGQRTAVCQSNVVNQISENITNMMLWMLGS